MSLRPSKRLASRRRSRCPARVPENPVGLETQHGLFGATGARGGREADGRSGGCGRQPRNRLIMIPLTLILIEVDPGGFRRDRNSRFRTRPPVSYLFG